MGSEVRLKFLGIRAIHDAPSVANALYGGSTNCIVIEDLDQKLIVNAGFGICPYGDSIFHDAKSIKSHVSCDLFLTDFLWDNIMGLPMFLPVHFKSSKISVHSAEAAASAKLFLSSICSRDMSPFAGVDSLNASLKFVAPDQNRTIGDWRISLEKAPSSMTPYPIAIWVFQHTSGFKIVFSGHSIDENVQNRMIAQIKDCNILIQSAIAPQLTHETMIGRWTFKEAIEFGLKINAGHTYITGVHPTLSDRDLLQSEVELKRIYGSHSNHAFSIAREWSSIPIIAANAPRKAG